VTKGEVMCLWKKMISGKGRGRWDDEDASHVGVMCDRVHR